MVGFGLPQCLLLFRIWAYGRGVGGAWSTTTSVLGVKKQHFSLPVQHDDVTINPTWQTATILKIVISPYLSRESSEYDEFWYADANFDQGDGNVRKFQKFPNSRWRMEAILKIMFLATNRLHIVRLRRNLE